MTRTLRRFTQFAAALALAAAVTGQAWAAQESKVTVALDWTPNTNHVGLFVAQAKGFYQASGLDVSILPYSDTAAGTLVANGLADFGVAGVGFYSQRAAGADLKAVYGIVQKETGRLVFDASRHDIHSPKDLDGKTYGGFGSAWEDALLTTLIRKDGGQGNFKSVTLGTSAYQALSSGAVDFTLEIVTWEGVEAELAGEKLKTFSYSDFGVPDQQTTLLVSSNAYLSAHSATARAFLTATQRGYAYAVDHPDEAADILIAANPDALTNKALVHASLNMLVKDHYLKSEQGNLGRIDPGKAEAIGGFLYAHHILKDGNGTPLTREPDFSAYFTNDYLLKH